MRTLVAGGARGGAVRGQPAVRPRTTWPRRSWSEGVPVHARRGEDADTYAEHVAAWPAGGRA